MADAITAADAASNYTVAVEGDLARLTEIQGWLAGAPIPKDLPVNKEILESLQEAGGVSLEQQIQEAKEVLSCTFGKSLFSILSDTGNKHQKWLSAFADCGSSSSLPSSVPLICTTEDVTKLRVYPKVLLQGDLHMPDSPNTAELIDYSKPTIMKINTDMKDEGTAKAWATEARGKKALLRSNIMTIDKVLKRYIIPDASADIISKMAVHIASYLKPMELRIGTTPEECVSVYEGNTKLSSCMKSTSGDAENWNDLYDDSGFHPIMFYGDHPELGVAGMYKNGACVARSVVSTKDKTWGRIFSYDSSYTSKFKEAMKDKGYTQYEDSYYSEGLPYTVPVRDGKLPVPYFDTPYEEMDLHVEYSPNQKEFIITTGGGGTQICGGTKGYITTSSVRSTQDKVCSVCKAKIPHNSVQYHMCVNVDVDVCNNTKCLERVGLRRVKQADGKEILTKPNTTQVKHGRTFYSNQHALDTYLGN